MRRPSALSLVLLASVASSAWGQEQHTQCRPIERAFDTGNVRANGAAQVWAQANGAARQRPDRAGFDEARYIYTYASGALYELYANPDFISTILLEEGETLEDVAAGDTSRWSVTRSVSAGLYAPRTILLVKPQAIGLRTNIVLVTDRRTYLVEAISHGREAYSAEIAWCYPSAGEFVATSSAGELHFDYRMRVTRGRRPTWTPIRVFDDGRRTWIEFGADIDATDLPPLFIVTGEGVELTNYRLDGRRYVVDRIFDAAELRLGVRNPSIVRIERGPATVQRSPRRGRP